LTYGSAYETKFQVSFGFNKTIVTDSHSLRVESRMSRLEKMEAPILVSLERAMVRFLEETPYRTSEYAIGFLDALGESLSGKFREENYPSIDDFYRSVETGRSGLSGIEGESISLFRGIYVLKTCPFVNALTKREPLDSKLRDFFERIVQDYNEERKPTTPIVNPFCILHDKLKGAYLENVVAEGRRVKFFIIARRSPLREGRVVMNREIVKGLKRNIRRALLETMRNYYCCCTYLLRRVTR